jgi:hypothetical protein
VIRYPLVPPETLHEAILHASMMASADPDHSYVIVCRKCGAPIHEHKDGFECVDNAIGGDT